MEQLVGNSVLHLDTSKVETYELHDMQELVITTTANTANELVIKLVEDMDLHCKIQLANHSQLHILFDNGAKHTKLQIEADVQLAATIKIGMYELSDSEVQEKVLVNLLAEDATAKIVSTSISTTKKTLDIECIHHAPNTNSDMNNFEISDAKANYDLRACGTIKKGAFGSKSHQMSRILTTSDDQVSKATPVLLIDENDVMASHANSMGKMDEQHLYYLTSRGMDEQQAKELLTLSYLLPISEVFDNEDMRSEYINKVRSRVGL
ncbi:MULTISPECIES: SufD family Fe-S cluster assembly protein [unclassified Breznakia]|uniref:SufB/SufD family protein n=1 Tax=unclassified Breznakia TaxID=2623764 RepID=UPI0024760248|nr:MULTISPECIES: SufD family Fe-S cluster assembly protein [unclassified Breznakia]MDH6367779.1 Fe-S cluster assembly protein SufD [Breznakia sp. PH1-1]MDH6404867.1 Fe-S cluster assembly protein SufD [Breznakia sp. PF1-11]MDH6412582.1 Fe-S cluster assembly protein SufD [Breznakia sp. PFB1-11]MDH6414942.1 Fe-S cluster assembly protein SufD [Breznakia sp. PFB1-14]MDH6417253.1 Fe-S cluster assembly protein SufD [Breznakia sp. PFB1-4]